jgi:hypothetical protein
MNYRSKDYVGYHYRSMMGTKDANGYLMPKDEHLKGTLDTTAR